jgi:hypothetical protein
MAGSEGLPAERDRVEQAWKEDGQFALMHDLTYCLRIGDVTVFAEEGPTTIEVKTNKKKELRSTPQTRRIKAAQHALRGAAPLPGDDPKERLHDLDLPLKTHLELLAVGTERAARDGIFAARVPVSRALLVADLYGCQAQVGRNPSSASGWSGSSPRPGAGPASTPAPSGTSTRPAWTASRATRCGCRSPPTRCTRSPAPG